MEISESLFFFFVGAIFICSLIPFIKYHSKLAPKKVDYQKNVLAGMLENKVMYYWNARKPFIVLILGCIINILLSIGVPKKTIVTDCGKYTIKRVLFPKGKYAWGEHEYIENQSNSYLYLQYIVYGNIDGEEIPEDVVIAPGSIQKIEGNINFYFEPFPENINMNANKKYEMRKALYCIDKEYLEEYKQNNSQEFTN